MKIIAVAVDGTCAQVLLADGRLVSLKTGGWLHTDDEWRATILRHIDEETELANENGRLRMLLDLAQKSLQ